MKKVATLILLTGCVILTSATHATAQGSSPGLAQVVTLDECDPATFNAPSAAGPDFCRNVALGYSTTFSDLFAFGGRWNPRSGLGLRTRQVGDQEGDHPIRSRPRR